MRWVFGFRRIAAAMLIAAVGGCATNALRVEGAGRVGEQGQVVAGSTRLFLRRVDTARREENVELVAADPACYAQPRTGPGRAAYRRAGRSGLAVRTAGLEARPERAFLL